MTGGIDVVQVRDDSLRIAPRTGCATAIKLATRQTKDG